MIALAKGISGGTHAARGADRLAARYGAVLHRPAGRAGPAPWPDVCRPPDLASSPLLRRVRIAPCSRRWARRASARALRCAGCRSRSSRSSRSPRRSSPNARILILDEPTAAPWPPEIELLFAKVRSLAAAGRRRPLHLAPAARRSSRSPTDRRAQGRRSVLAAPRRRLDQDADHPRHGRPAAVGDLPGKRAGRRATCVLEVERLAQRGAFEDVSFAVHAGEIVGIFGPGRQRAAPRSPRRSSAPARGSGTVRLDGKDARFTTRARRCGAASRC